VGQEPVAHESHVVLAEQLLALPTTHGFAHFPELKRQTSPSRQSSLLPQLAWQAGKKKRDATRVNEKSERKRTIPRG